MKLVLKNFRCFEDKTIDFKDNFSLISGPSGAGKTSILKAFNFVLYDNEKKPVMNGKNSCSVEFVYNESTIVTRTKKPNRLLVTYNETEYEDDAGQEIINTIFGKNFDITSYMAQNAINSFILMSPTDKLLFLENFAFKNVDIELIKSRCKSIIQTHYNTLNRTTNELEMLRNMFGDLTEPEEVKFPIKTKDKEKSIKNQQIKYKNCDVLIKKARNSIGKMNKELSDLRVLNSFIESNNDNIESLSEKLNNLKLEDVEYIGDDTLDDYKNRLNSLISRRKYTELDAKIKEDTEKLEEMKKSEIDEYQRELADIQSKLWKEYTREEVEDNISSIKTYIEDIQRVNLLKKQISFEVHLEQLDIDKNKLEELRTTLETKQKILEQVKLQKEIFRCPSCESSIKFKDNNLFLVDSHFDNIDIENVDDLQADINLIKTQIKKLETSINRDENNLQKKQSIEEQINQIVSEYDEEFDYSAEKSLKGDLKDLENYLNSQNTLEQKKIPIEESITHSHFSISYKLLRSSIASQKIQLKELSKGEIEEDMDEEELRKIISEEEKNKIRFEKANRDRRVIQNDITKNTRKIDGLKATHIELYKNIKKEDEIVDEIKSEQSNIVDYETTKKELGDVLEQIEKYNKYVEDLDKYNSYKTKIEELGVKENKDKKIYNASLLLKEKILEAESIAIINIINSINHHAQYYLEQFFPDNPILVKLLSFKENNKTKNNKPCINIEIDYKGMDCDINMLSGGELSRINLAFTLALSEIFNNPILLLDECTSNLNQELTTLVFDTIKESFSTKTVIIIAHQIVEGIFGEIINMS